MDDRFNTIAGWTLFAGIVALGGSIVAGEILPRASARKRWAIRSRAWFRKAKAGPKRRSRSLSISRSADAAAGEQVFKKCMACHNADKGGANALGPNLWGVLGEPVGKGHGFAFSPALAGVGGTWNWDNLSAWLHSPKKFAPGTKMTFAGLSNPQDRANVIAFLNAHSDGPLPLPAAPAEAAAPAAGDKAAARRARSAGTQNRRRQKAAPRSQAAASQ